MQRGRPLQAMLVGPLKKLLSIKYQSKDNILLIENFKQKRQQIHKKIIFSTSSTLHCQHNHGV